MLSTHYIIQGIKLDMEKNFPWCSAQASLAGKDVEPPLYIPATGILLNQCSDQMQSVTHLFHFQNSPRDASAVASLSIKAGRMAHGVGQVLFLEMCVQHIV